MLLFRGAAALTGRDGPLRYNSVRGFCYCICMTTEKLGGKFTFPGTHLTVNRVGFGAMQLTGPHIFGEPKDRDQAVAVVREAIASGINHIDTSDYYGPHAANRIIKEAIHPYPEDLVIVSKLGAVRGDDASWIMAHTPEDYRAGVEGNLKNLGLDAIDIMNMRVGGVEGPDDSSIAERLSSIIKLKEEGLIKHIGISNVSPKQFAEAEAMTDIVCVQNYYNLAHRYDDEFIDALAAKGIAFVPFFPLGGFQPLQDETLERIAGEVGAPKMQVALAWLLHRSPNILLIPGTSSLGHLRENIAAAEVKLSPEVLEELNAIGKSA
jgi:pyridoxine 4-dehydrogenase